MTGPDRRTCVTCQRTSSLVLRVNYNETCHSARGRWNRPPPGPGPGSGFVGATASGIIMMMARAARTRRVTPVTVPVPVWVCQCGVARGGRRGSGPLPIGRVGACTTSGRVGCQWPGGGVGCVTVCVCLHTGTVLQDCASVRSAFFGSGMRRAASLGPGQARPLAQGLATVARRR